MNYNHPQNFPPLQFSQSVVRLARFFQSHGFELYAVGGAVRNMILAMMYPQKFNIAKYDDIDFTTNASPSQIMQILKNTIPTGIAHGTITVLFEEHSYEITTYRIESQYKDHRHPSEIQFSSSIEEDLARRDFTINAIALNPIDNTLIDLYNGIQDLRDSLIRCVGIPNKRYGEDALRMLRAIRFASKLNFTIAQPTLNAIFPLKDTLSLISKERVCTELRKMLCSSAPDYAINLLIETGLFSIIFPTHPTINPSYVANFMSLHLKLHAHTNTDYFTNIQNIENNTYNNTVELNSQEECIRLAICLSITRNDITNSLETSLTLATDTYTQHIKYVKETLKALRLPNLIIKQVLHIIMRQHYLKKTISLRLSPFKIALMIAKLGLQETTMIINYLKSLVFFQYYLAHSHNNTIIVSQALNTLSILDSVQNQLQDTIFVTQCITIKEMKIDGTKLCKLLRKVPGKWLGSLLSTLHRHVLRYPEDNNVETLTILAKIKFRISPQ